MKLKIKKIDENTFDNYAENHPLKNYYQTSSYGKLLIKHGYYPIYIAGYDENNTIVGASLILIKRIKGIKYGYSPRGFLINFFDEEFLKLFTKKVKRFFYRRFYAFIKINPEVTLSLVDDKTNTKTVNKISKKLVEDLVRLNYIKLKNNIYFESFVPKYNAVINLASYSRDILSKNITNILDFTENSGLSIVKNDKDNIDDFINLVGENKTTFENYFNTFGQKGLLDVWYVQIDFAKYIELLQKEYTKEFKNNEKLNDLFYSSEDNQELYNQKLESDKKLALINKDITTASKNINNGKQIDYIGGMITIRYGNRASIVKTYFKPNHYENITNYYLYHNILMEYKKEGLKYIDFNGISGDTFNSNPYKESSEFKLNFKPKILEYIGEFDLVIHQSIYAILWGTKSLQNEFEKGKKPKN